MKLEKKRGLEQRRAFYTRVYRQLFSPEGDWLIASDSRSRICIFSVAAALSQKAFVSSLRSVSAYVNLKHPVYALCSFKNILLCGDSYGNIFAYQWSSMKSAIPTALEPKRVFAVNHFSMTGEAPLIASEINSIVSIDSKILYGGAGGNVIRLLDPERPDKIASSFSGHTEYVNELKARSSNEFLSASEDGTVRLWDLRMNDVVHTIRVCEEVSLRAPNRGKGVCALDVQGSFMVCGGDVQVSIWHLDSRSLASTLSCNDSSTMRYTAAKMEADKILVGGTCNELFQFDYSGKKLATVTTTPSSIYSIESNHHHGRMMTAVAGDSQYIDAFLSLGYVSFKFDTSFDS